MIILAIETSCDDTSIAIIKIKKRKNSNLADFDILSNIVSSQVKIHQKYGGVYPALAKREHQRNLLPVLKRALKQGKLLKILNPRSEITNQKLQTLEKILEKEPELLKDLIKFLEKHEKIKIDGIAVTAGPGLEPCLWTGINFAKALAYFWNLPIIPVNHIEGHILANFLPKISENINNQLLIINNKKRLPAIALVVSGGHTQLILIKKFGQYKIIGETRDDAAGECFDKTARILGLPYPGGPSVAKMATKIKNQKSKIKNIELPRPMIYQKNYDFSFSGLKTAVLYDYKNRPVKTRKSKKYIEEMSAEIQQAIIDVLIRKTIKAAKDYKVKTIIIGGGVTANKELRKQLKEKIKKEMPTVEFLMPAVEFSGDNAAMAAIAGYYHWQKNKTKNWKNIKAKANLRIASGPTGCRPGGKIVGKSENRK